MEKTKHDTRLSYTHAPEQDICVRAISISAAHHPFGWQLLLIWAATLSACQCFKFGVFWTFSFEIKEWILKDVYAINSMTFLVLVKVMGANFLCLGGACNSYGQPCVWLFLLSTNHTEKVADGKHAYELVPMNTKFTKISLLNNILTCFEVLLLQGPLLYQDGFWLVVHKCARIEQDQISVTSFKYRLSCKTKNNPMIWIGHEVYITVCLIFN